MMVERSWVLERRLALQGLTKSTFGSALAAVRRLGCVQSQELVPALNAVGIRAGHTSIDTTAVELSSGAFVRTHILRPTWHFVAAEDLRWILAATSPKVERAVAHRHRALGLDSATIGGFLDRMQTLLAETKSMTRAEIRAEFPQYDGSAVSHLLMVAELRALVCSGPLQGLAHTYRLADDFIPPADIDVEAAKVRLVHRFFAGHGPAEISDLTRWAALTKSEVQSAVAELGDQLEGVEVDGFDLYHDPSIQAEFVSGDYLLHTFDEATLTYPRLNFPRTPGHPLGEISGPFMAADPFAGAFVSGTDCPGGWRMSNRRGQVNIRLDVVPSFRARVEAAARIYAAYLGKPITIS